VTEGMQPGEIERALARIERDLKEFRTEARDRSHALANQMNAQLGRVSEHTVRIDNLEKRQDAQSELVSELGTDVKDIAKNANRIAGAWSAVTVAIGLGIAWLKGR